jgi:hypothetical protein
MTDVQRVESEDEDWAWYQEDLGRCKEGKPCDKVRARAVAERWAWDVDVEQAYRDAGLVFISPANTQDEQKRGLEDRRARQEAWAAEQAKAPPVEIKQPEPEPPNKALAVVVAEPKKAVVPLPTEPNVNAETALAAMNDRHAVIGNVGGKCLALDWIKDPVDSNRLIPSFQNRRDIENRYSRHHVTVEEGDRKKKVGLGKWWWDHPGRADYRGVLFEPGGPLILPDNHLNLWRGWGVLPAQGDWSRMEWHIRNVLAAGDPKAADYILRWTAWGFQNPNRPAETAVIFRGAEGSGKGVFGRAIKTIYGPHGFQISQPRHLTGNFNAHLWTCCFLFADEAFWAGDRQGEGILKALITEDVLMIEKKRIDQFQAKNFIKLMLASNESWVIPAGQNARRYNVNDVDNRYAEGHCGDGERDAYFSALYEECRNGGLAGMLWDLRLMDLGGWHPRIIYRTAALTHQKKESLRGNRQWFEVLLQRGSLPKPVPSRPDRILTDDLIEWARGFRGCEYLNDTSLATFLYEMGLTEDNRFRLPKGGKRGWQFPLLSDARAAWSKLYGGTWEWDEELADWA